MYYGTIKNCDIANGTGVRVSLFVSGCTNHCEGCFQPQTWDFCYGEPFTKQTEETLLSMLEPAYIDGLTVLGGEPFEPQNQRDLLPFLSAFKSRFPNKSLWMFSGFTLDELTTDGSHPRCEVTDQILAMVDVLIDGRFVLAKKNISLQFRGSENQRIIDMNRTREEGKVVLWNS